MEFKAGDIVEFGGLEGVVKSVGQYGAYPVNVIFRGVPNDDEADFTLDGRYIIQQTRPVLHLVSRPKKKITKTMERWVNMYGREYSECHDSLEAAEAAYENRKRYLPQGDRDACVKLTGTYEVEE